MNRLLKTAALIAALSGISTANAVDIPYSWNDTLQGSSDPGADDTICGTYSLPTIKTGMLFLDIEADASPGDITVIVHRGTSTGTVAATLVSPVKKPVAIASVTPHFLEIKCKTSATAYSPGLVRAWWSGAGKNLYVNTNPGAHIQLYDAGQGSLVSEMDASNLSGLAKFPLQPGSYLVRATYNGAEAWAGSNGALKPRENASSVSISTSDKVVSVVLGDPPVIDSAAIDPATRKVLIQGTGFGDDPGYIENFSNGKLSRSTPSNTTALNWTDFAIYGTPGTLSTDRCVRVFSSIGGWSPTCVKY
ncbi:hypothetical protein [Methylomagnum ishizawai]|uniref:hypothetical protein n=1 Tax=Methylomagnum ishizawai TaxID=1760988 RepID=UPI001C33FDDB|nr:hypothetical protein [Methylomagnum ishizawai]BBL77529.1 hypothetical protein MishRS11D_46270 [Methylomagnum ishizawai]